jgi:hypothetical protein
VTGRIGEESGRPEHAQMPAQILGKCADFAHDLIPGPELAARALVALAGVARRAS